MVLLPLAELFLFGLASLTGAAAVRVELDLVFLLLPTPGFLLALGAYVLL